MICAQWPHISLTKSLFKKRRSNFRYPKTAGQWPPYGDHILQGLLMQLLSIDDGNTYSYDCLFLFQTGIKDFVISSLSNSHCNTKMHGFKKKKKIFTPFFFTFLAVFDPKNISRNNDVFRIIWTPYQRVITVVDLYYCEFFTKSYSQLNKPTSQSSQGICPSV